MPLPMRALALRTALERATDTPVDFAFTNTAARLTTPAPSTTEVVQWQALLTALAHADRWGTTDADGTVRVWAEIDTPDGRGTP